MPQGQRQQRNPELVRNLTSDFLTNERFFLDGARLLSAVLSAHAAGGGQLMYGWLADSRQNYGAGATTLWTETNITPADYFATTYGGPYVNLDGATEYLSIADAAWQEGGSEELFVWHWVNAQTLAGADRVICSKHNTAANQSWRLYWNNGAGAFRFSTSAVGNADTEVTSTYAETTSVWYFVAGYFQPSTLMRIYVGAATGTGLTIDSLAVGIPASLFNGNASLAIGCSFAAAAAASWWNGYIGIGSARFNIPPTDVDAYASRLFAMTQALYQ